MDELAGAGKSSAKYTGIDVRVACQGMMQYARHL
jgi:hypothetical protein